MIGLSRPTKTRIRALFPQHDWPAVDALLLSHCGDNLPFLQPKHDKLAERIRFAVLQLSDGGHDLLDVAKRSGIAWASVRRAAQLLEEHGLLREAALDPDEPGTNS